MGEVRIGSLYKILDLEIMLGCHMFWGYKNGIEIFVTKLEKLINTSSTAKANYFLALATIGKELQDCIEKLKKENMLDLGKFKNLRYLQFKNHPLFKQEKLHIYNEPKVLDSKPLLTWNIILSDFLREISSHFVA